MRNYIILNGKNSQSIQGLLIQSLAPISKPLMRTQIEEIDGRNGDIVEDLGFSAYDKQITVGLYGEYDVDEVIAYFNSKGTVVFSNEPEKYYNYEIVDQIDFERLVRYKTATVTMHCQPFKYSTVEAAETLSPTDNLLSIPDFTKTTNGITVTANDGIISVQGTGTASTEFYVPIESLTLEAGSYTLDATASGTNPSACSLRLIGSAPSNSDSFGGKYIALTDGTVTLQATLTASKTFGFLWFYINAGTALNFKLTVEVEDDSAKVASGEGSALVLEGTGENKFNKLVPKGNASQQTYSGKNLFNYTSQTYPYTDGGITATLADDGTITVTGVLTRNYVVIVPQTDITNLLQDGQTYTISASVVTPNLFLDIAALDASSSSHTIVRTRNQSSVTFTVDKTTYPTYYAKFQAYNMATWGSASLTISIKVQLEKGNSVTSFEKYVGGIPSPNPNYPQEIQVVTGEQTVKITGRNLLQIPDGTSSRNGVELTAEGGILTLSGTLTNEATAYGVDASLRNANYSTYLSWGNTTLSAGTYTLSYARISGSTTTTGAGGSFLRAEICTRPVGDTGRLSTSVARVPMEASDGFATFTLDEDAEVNIVVYLYGRNNTVDMTFKLMLEFANSSSQYEPFQSQSYPIALGTTYLAKIPNTEYVDEPVKVDGTWYIRRKVGKVVLDGSESWSAASVTGGYTFYTADITDYSRLNSIPMSDYFLGAINAPGAGAAPEGRIAFATATITQPRLYVRYNAMFADLDSFQAWLSTHPTSVYYALAEPVDEEITNEALIEQLEALEQAHSYKYRTHLMALAATGNVPHILAVEAAKSSDGTITNSGNYISKPKLTIYGEGDIGVYLNGLQIFQIALGDEGYITIDTNAMEAYKDTLDNLKNRLVTGEYENFALKVGENKITFSGTVTKCIVENYSRWL